MRYSKSDLNYENILGGEQSDITLGLKWYLNPSTRIMFNNVFADIKGAGKANIFQVRFQIDFNQTMSVNKLFINKRRLIIESSLVL